MNRSTRILQQCVIETLEHRRLLSDSPWTTAGPVPLTNDPFSKVVNPGGRPIALLMQADDITEARAGTYAFKVSYRDDIAVRGSTIDDNDVIVTGPNGYSRRALLISVDQSGDGPERVARYKISSPGADWDRTDNGRYSVQMRPSQVYDVPGQSVASGQFGEFDVQIGDPTPPPAPPTPPPPPPPPPGGGPDPRLLGLDVRDFGAVPNDNIDDTSAIQAAIDSLPRSSGVPTGAAPAGGIVLLPAGVFDINRSIRLHSGVTLRGSGVNTVIHDTSTDRNHAAILLYSPFAHRFNVGATVEDLSIYTRWAGGIWADPNMGGDVVDLRLANLRMSTMGSAIDLRQRSLYHSDIDNVEVYNPGSTALRFGRYDGFGGADVRVRDFRVTGVARSGFRAEQGMVQLIGHSLVQGLNLDYTGANVVPLYVSDLLFNTSAIGPTMYDVRINVPAANCPGGVAALFENVARVDIDYISGIGADHKIKLINAHDVQIGYLNTDGTTNVLPFMVLRDSRSHLRVNNESAGLLQFPQRQQPPAPHVPVPAPTNVIDARNFGVVPDDGRDDTAAIQAAIDSLPRGSGIPGSGGAVGGIVQLPLGDLITSAPIKLPSGVWLRGHNNGTVIRNSTSPAGRGVIELTSPYSHRSNVGAAIDSLGLWSTAASAIIADSTVVAGELRDLRIVGVHIFVGGAGVDLRNVKVNYANIDRVIINDTGSNAAIWVGRPDNSSVGNIVRGVRVTGRIRNSFVPTDKGLFTFMGDTTMEGGSIGDPATVAPIMAFYASGKININGLWLEYPRHSSNIGFLLDNAQGSIDWLAHIDPWDKLHVINDSDIRLNSLNIDGAYALLRDTISVDATSKLTLGTVNGAYDSGMLDHPRVIVKGFYNSAARNFVETADATNGTNLLADPNMTSISDYVDGDVDWKILWADGYQGRKGTYTVETLAGGVKRLRVDLAQSGYFSIRVRLNVPDSAAGRHGFGRWRIDGPAQAFVWNYANAAQYPTRAMGSLTAARTPMHLTPGDQLWINLGSVNNPVPAGTYTFWKFGVVAG
jgi:hypothetical protein